MDSPPDAGRPRRHVALAVAGALVVASLGSAAAAGLTRVDLSPACGPGAEELRMPGLPVACVHADVPPPGIDVTEPVSTAELKRREGAGPTAVAAAEELGVASAEAAAEPSRAVPCDGDGVSGYRVQAMYVVEATRTNRYASLKGSMEQWAAGANEVFNRSAALTGGVRDLRYVTAPGPGGTCVAEVLNVTVPAGSTSSFNNLISAVRALGYDEPNRKYLMWADATILCGVAGMYPSDSAAQSNPNNGSYPQYARVDAGCWGLPNQSVEAHELVHTFGGVQSTAPHGTRAGHCWDESDRMCYADGGGFPMRQICSVDREPLLDCNSDDYFSTFPEPGSYLDTRWNSANSRFLIGGGNGSAGGSAGAPTTLGARIAVNNPAVPGLVTQATVTPVLPQGRTLASVRWTAARRDCTFATPTEVQSTVHCPATAAGSTTVTATLTDSGGATKTVTSPLTFATGTARPVALALSVHGQTGTPTMCTGTIGPVAATVTDTASGQPVKGLSVAFSRRAQGATVTSSAGSAVSTDAGSASISLSATLPTTYGAATTAGTVYAAGPRTELAATTGRCTADLTGTADSLEVFHGDPVTVSGTLTRTVDAQQVPVAGASLPVTLTTRTTSATGVVMTRTTSLGTARTDSAGGYRLVTKPTASGTLAVTLPASAGYVGATATLGELTVRLPQSALTAAVDRTDVGYAGPMTVTGTLHRVAGGLTTAATGQSVAVRVTPPGRSAVTVGTGRVLADGSFRAPVALRQSGRLSAVYGGAPGLPAATVDLGEVTAGTWSTALTATTSATSTTLGTPVTLSGTLTRSYGGVSDPAAYVPLRVSVQGQGATTSSLMSASTGPTGTFTLRVYPRVTTTYTVRLMSVTGYADAQAAPVQVEVR